MAFVFQERYEPQVEERMRAFGQTLSERDRRRFAALEAARLGHGGGEYIAEVLGCSVRTIERGAHELDQLPDDPAAGRVRRPGGGRKKKIESDPALEQNLKSILEVRIAGDPDTPDVWWTDLSPRQIADVATERGTPVSPPVVQDWMEEQKLARHQIEKSLAGGQSPDRDAQFRRIATWKAEYVAAGNPVFSVDTKAEEHLGQLFRKGRVWTQEAFRAFDHDFPSWATGVIIPHGIYDLARNCGHLNIGLSHDTSQFACDSFRWYWNRIGRRCYPDATSILWLCDCGGSNSAAQYLFKQDLQNLVNELGIEIRVAHKAVIAWERYMREVEGIEASTIRRRLAALSSLFAHLVRYDAVDRNPVREIEWPQINRREGSTLAFSKAQARKILDAPDAQTIPGLRDRAILSVGFQVGLRRAEIAALRVGDLHQNRGFDSLRVTRKGAKKDALAINPQTAQRIRAYLDAAGQAEDLEGPMFRPLHNNGKQHSPRRHMNPDAIDRVVRKFARRIGLDRGYSAHSMRATFITTALDNGCSLEDVQRAAGHADPSTTKLYDRRGYNPEKSASFFANY